MPPTDFLGSLMALGAIFAPLWLAGVLLGWIERHRGARPPRKAPPDGDTVSPSTHRD